jgi:pantoate--beta-alanine ligase
MTVVEPSPSPIVLDSIAEVREASRRARSAGRTIGLVPTMGALHEGHARLIDACRAKCDHVVVSIYVNPTQFGPGEDLDRYPRTLEADLAICRERGVDVVFAPKDREMYPQGTIATKIEVGAAGTILEGAIRPGHFQGVATVVLKLFGIVVPDRAYFGRKDFQQQLIIRKMVDDLNVPVLIEVVPTVRERDGLALSSRNRFLEPEDREAATVLFWALERAKSVVKRGERNAEQVAEVLAETIEAESRAKLDYAVVVDADSLEAKPTIVDPARSAALVAARFGAVRLIDNTLLA